MMHGLNTYDYGARQYSPILPMWDRVDPLAEKYYNVSPYAYCMNDPVNYVDPDGKVVRPYGEKALSIIKNTLPQDARDYIKLTDNGVLDTNLMRQYEGDSDNFRSLMTLASNQMEISVTTLQETQYISNGKIFKEKFRQVEFLDDLIDKNFNSCSGNTTGECANLGVTYMPSNGKVGKSDAKDPNSIHININPSLSPIGAAEAFSHEGYGHALIYVETEGDRDRAVHHFVGTKESNRELIDKSIRARKETVKNMGL